MNPSIRSEWVRSRTCPVERGAAHKIGYVFGKLSVEHADAMHNLVRVSEFVRQVRRGSSMTGSNGHKCVTRILGQSRFLRMFFGSEQRNCAGQTAQMRERRGPVRSNSAM
jgi:hypothetical protein